MKNLSGSERSEVLTVLECEGTELRGQCTVIRGTKGRGDEETEKRYKISQRPDVKCIMSNVVA